MNRNVCSLKTIFYPRCAKIFDEDTVTKVIDQEKERLKFQFPYFSSR